MSKRRLHAKLALAEAEIVRLKVELAALGPIIAAAGDLRDADTWLAHAASGSDDDAACEALDAAIEAICAAVDARRAGGAVPASDIPDGWVMDAPVQEAEEVAVFLADYEWPGDEVAA
jgi:hypothetical protein